VKNDEPWTSIVIAPGETRHHGRDPQNLSTTLCGAVEVTEHTLYRAPFYGSNDDDCPICADLLPENHY
jgi:hypothetical protein